MLLSEGIHNCNLRRRRGAGVIGRRNEYVRALAISHDDPRADKAIAERGSRYGRTLGTYPHGSFWFGHDVISRHVISRR